MPVQFSGIKQEHETVRTKAGLFDVSHMGEIMVSGRMLWICCKSLTTNDVSKLKTGAAQYTIMCNEDGGTIDVSVLKPDRRTNIHAGGECFKY